MTWLNNKILSLYRPKHWLNSLNRDWFLVRLLFLLTGISAIVIVLITVFISKEAFPVLRSVGIKAFFLDSSWNPSEQAYNILPMLLGSLFVTLGSVALAAPLGIISAIFCHYYAPNWLASVYRRLIELLAGIPSVVYGFWGLVVLVPLINRIHAPGASLLAGICVLAVMILPTMALVADASLAQVPSEYILGAASLGLSRWGTVWGVAIPAAKSGLLAGGVLQMGRAMGETMAVVMVCGNVVQIPDSIFASIRTLTANIALEMAYALGNHRSALFFSGLMLIIVMSLLVLVGQLLMDN